MNPVSEKSSNWTVPEIPVPRGKATGMTVLPINNPWNGEKVVNRSGQLGDWRGRNKGADRRRFFRLAGDWKNGGERGALCAASASGGLGGPRGAECSAGGMPVTNAIA